MKKIAVILLFISNTVFAQETVWKYDFTDTKQVFLATTNCRVPYLKGKAAVFHDSYNEIDIIGCWYTDPFNSHNYRIDWDNPRAPGDFSVLEKDLFEKL